MESFTNPDGTTGFRLGMKGLGGDGFTKPTESKIQLDQINIGNRLSRVAQIKASMTSGEFLTFKGKGKAALFAFFEKGGGKLSPENEKFLSEFTKAKAAAFSDLNATLKELSGAAVNPQEAERLLKEIADFRNDSPTEFAAKIERIERGLQLARSRLHFIGKTKGFLLTKVQLLAAFKETPLDSFDAFMKTKATAIVQEIQTAKPGISEADLLAETQARLAALFGLSR